MPNDENKIILEFPATNVEIELGETITFDNISGFLDSGRVTYDGDSLTEKITHLENDKADTTYVNTELAKKADKTDTYTRSQVDDIVYNILPDDTASGSVANFTTSLELPIKSLEVDVNAVQSAGTPTPSSPKAISGWNAITLDANGNTEVINLGGTYYGGHFTQDKDGHRQLVITSESKKINEFDDWLYLGGYNYFECAVENMKGSASTSVLNGLICECYATRTAQQAGSGDVDCSIAGWTHTSTNESRIRIKDNKYSSVTAWLSAVGEYLVIYPLAEPIVIDLPDGEPIITLNGTNNIYADSGDSAVEYKCSVAEYVANHSGGGGAKSLGGVFLGGSNSGGEEEPIPRS